MQILTSKYPNVASADYDAALVVEKWVDFVNSGDVSGVSGLYAEDSVMLPTFSPHVSLTEKDRVAYFESLGSRNGLGVYLHEKTLRVRPISECTKVASGIYRFSFEIDGEPLAFEARFTYVIEVAASRPIRHHHSSQVPRTLT